MLASNVSRSTQSMLVCGLGVLSLGVVYWYFNRDKQATRKLPIKTVVVVGAPGAGKGTLCKKHPVEDFGYFHLSVRDHLRELASKPHAFPPEVYAGVTPNELSATMAEARLLSDATVVAIIKSRLEHVFRETGKDVFIIDGFPRAVASADLYDRAIGKPSALLWLDAGSKDKAKNRFVNRRREGNDNAAKFETRYEQYLQDNTLIMDWYGSVVHKVDTACSEEDSHRAMYNVMKQLQ